MQRRKGFTLIELMIVIAIIGILAAIAVPNFRKAREQARTRACHANCRVLQGAVEMYNMDQPATNMFNDVDLQRAGTLQQLGYLREVPKCPSENAYTYGACRIDNNGNWQGGGSLTNDAVVGCVNGTSGRHGPPGAKQNSGS